MALEHLGVSRIGTVLYIMAQNEQAKKLFVMDTTNVPPGNLFNSNMDKVGEKTKERISTSTQKLPLSVNVSDAVLFEFSVSIKSGDNRTVDGKDIGKEVIDIMYQTNSSEILEKPYAYDDEQALYTVPNLHQNEIECRVVLEDTAIKCHCTIGSPALSGILGETAGLGTRQSIKSKTYDVRISIAVQTPVRRIDPPRKGLQAENNGDSLTVIDIIMRLLNANRYFVDGAGNLTAWDGCHLCPTQGGSSLNMDVSTTMCSNPGLLLDFIFASIVKVISLVTKKVCPLQLILITEPAKVILRPPPVYLGNMIASDSWRSNRDRPLLFSKLNPENSTGQFGSLHPQGSFQYNWTNNFWRDSVILGWEAEEGLLLLLKSDHRTVFCQYIWTNEVIFLSQIPQEYTFVREWKGFFYSPSMTWWLVGNCHNGVCCRFVYMGYRLRVSVHWYGRWLSSSEARSRIVGPIVIQDHLMWLTSDSTLEIIPPDRQRIVSYELPLLDVGCSPLVFCTQSIICIFFLANLNLSMNIKSLIYLC
ncbi:hypothetical protein AQUCO_02200115v1 [Aquilegia coerulea]|uniref:Uncharacterized protein n=1 Tax=Aquilegia coerulea TaxID=218851 RepID=A0A2G5DDB0_AQUCA|nr:hypothetical protein AQUCO_02200115v1 [Aquilegia coerulea]